MLIGSIDGKYAMFPQYSQKMYSQQSMRLTQFENLGENTIHMI